MESCNTLQILNEHVKLFAVMLKVILSLQKLTFLNGKSTNKAIKLWNFEF